MNTRYSYDRRQAANSATPGLDAIVKSDLEPKLKQCSDRAVRLVDKAEDLGKKVSRTSYSGMDALMAEYKKATAGAAQEAYKTLDILRPALSNGRRELAEMADLHTEAVKEATALVGELHKLDGFRNQVLEGIRELVAPTDFAPALHNLAMSCVFVKDLYRQFRDAYWEHR